MRRLVRAKVRPDRAAAEALMMVEVGRQSGEWERVRLQQSHGKAFASEFLVRRAIPVNVIVRVLSDPPGRRRATPRGRRQPLGAVRAAVIARALPRR